MEQEHVVEGMAELRIEVGDTAVEFEIMKGGFAEVFGAELAIEKKYKLKKNSNVAIFTYQGCTVKVFGNPHMVYKGSETPMNHYLNVHRVLQQKRDQGIGPKVLIAGPTDSGKSTLSTILLNYAVRQGATPIFVDCDVGQGSITVPGVIAAIPIDRTIDVQAGLSVTAPLGYFYGHNSLNENPGIYRHYLQKMASSLEKLLANNKSAQQSGFVLNTCGWVEGLGKELLLDIVEYFGVDTILVLNDEKLGTQLESTVGRKPGIQVVKLPKSGGVVKRNVAFRKLTRFDRIKEYFYGANDDLRPHSQVIGFDDVDVYQFYTGVTAPSDTLPIGATPKRSKTDVEKVAIDGSLGKSVLAVTNAQTPEELAGKNVLGYVYVEEVDLEARTLRCLLPAPGELPSRILMNGTLKWIE